jgi:hypothetical protein
MDAFVLFKPTAVGQLGFDSFTAARRRVLDYLKAIPVPELFSPAIP